MRLQVESQVPSIPLISSMKLCQAVAAHNIEQVYIVTPIHSFLSVVENFKYSSGLHNVFVDEIVSENVFEKETQKQRLGGNPCLEKPVLIACENNKTKAKAEKTCRYATILYSLMSEFRDVFPYNLPDGLSPCREVDHSI